MNDQLIKSLQGGIDICKKPFESLGKELGLSGDSIICEIKEAIQANIIKRFGAVVHHKKLGYSSNAMVVWDFTSEEIDKFGDEIAKYDFVKLCYQRPKIEGVWPYNLFCMIFGKSKEEIETNINKMRSDLKLQEIDFEILYTTKAYKQNGARYR